MANPVAFPSRPFQLRVVAWVAQQDIQNNLSQIGWQVWIDKTGTSPTASGGAASRWMAINGVMLHENYGNGFDFVNGTNFLIGGTGYTWYSHDADGVMRRNDGGGAGMLITAQAEFDILGTTQMLTDVLAVPTIPRASTTSIAAPYTRDAGTAIVLNTNRASSGFTHTLKYTFGSLTGTIATGVGDSYTWTPPLSLLTAIPNSTSALIAITTETYSGGTFIGSTVSQFTLAAGVGVVPTVSNLARVEGNSAVAAVMGAGVFVQGLSTLQGTVTAAGVQGSTITATSFGMGDQTTPSGGTIPVTASGTIPVAASAIDSRGRIGTWTGSIVSLPYSPPNVTQFLVRRSTAAGVVDDAGTSLRVDLTAAVSSLINSTQKNTLQIKVSTRAYGTSTWTLRNTINHSAITYNSNFVVSGGANYPINASFDVKVEIVDKFNTSAAQTIVATAAVFMHWSQTGVGIGKYHSLGKLDVAGDVYANSVLLVPAATSAETITGTSAVKAVTPAALVARTATDARTGIVELATQAENDTGTDTTRAVTPATVRNRAYAPWSMAGGRVASSAVNNVVTFPSGRFSVPPLVQVTLQTYAAYVTVLVTSVTATSCNILVYNTTTGNSITGIAFDWVATQMTSAAAAG